MQLDVITLFPEMFEAVSRCGITRRALEEGRFNLQAWNPRDFTTDNYKTIDDRPYGGGPGMVMMAEPLDAAIEAARSRQDEAGIAATKVIYLSPQGETLTDAMVRELAAEPGLVLVAGRYEGVDERLVRAQGRPGNLYRRLRDLRRRIAGDGGDRRDRALLPGVLNDAESAKAGLVSEGLLDWPHYTRPEEWQGERVPEVLMSGNHAAIATWRRKQALGRTMARRPDLLEGRALTKEDAGLLEEYRKEQEQQ